MHFTIVILSITEEKANAFDEGYGRSPKDLRRNKFSNLYKPLHMNKPLMSRWYVKLTLVVLIIATVYLVIKSFNTGREEGKQKAQQEAAQ
jgi:hypothetical protein